MQKIITTMILTVLLITSMFMMWNVMYYPEKYFTTWRASLERDVRAGNSEAVKYYEDTYLKNDIRLFEM